MNDEKIIHKVKRCYYDMKFRCYNVKARNYHLYGGRGIKICEEWLNDINAFVSWSLNHGVEQKLMIDRIDNDDNYSPENCRWTTRHKSNLNRRTTTTNFEKGTRVCQMCKIEKELTQFNRSSDKFRGGYQNRCRDCDNKTCRDYYQRRKRK